MSKLVYFVPVFVAVFLPFMVFLISRFGWSVLARTYKARGTFTGERIGIISAAVNTANYKNSLLLKISEEGLYLKPLFIFRMFHPPLLIPWTAISSTVNKDGRFGTVTEIAVGTPAVATIVVMETTFAKVEHMLPRSRRRPS